MACPGFVNLGGLFACSRLSSRFPVACKQRPTRASPCVATATEPAASPSFREAPLRGAVPPPEGFSWTRAWYPVMWERDFEETRPHSFTVFDLPLVMFRDAETREYVVFLDVCPHRAVPLSEGRLVEKKGEGTLLECGYHGWTFDRKGDCVRIPQCPPEQRIPRGASCRRRFATTTKLGIIFVWFGEYTEADKSLLPLPPIIDRHPNAIIYRDQVRILPYSYEMFIENILDPAHVPFVHHGTGDGDRNKVDPAGFIEIIEVDPKTGAFSSRKFATAQSTDRYLTCTFKPPCLVSYEFEMPTVAFCLITMAVPIREQNDFVRVLTFNAIDIGGFPRWFFKLSPRWFGHAKVNRILDGDLLLLRGQERWINASHPHEEKPPVDHWRSNYFLASNTMDLPVLRFRKWFDFTCPKAPWITSPSTLTAPYDTRARRVNLDRYEQHTRHCKSCRSALRRLRLIRNGLLFLAAVFGVLCVTLFAPVLLGASVATFSTARWSIIFLISMVCMGVANIAQRWIGKLTFTEESYILSHAK